MKRKQILQKLQILSSGHGQKNRAVDHGLGVHGQSRTKYRDNTKDKGRQGLYTHEEGRPRWKQSGIRGDVRPVTQEEGQVN